MADVVRIADFKEISALAGGILSDTQALIGKEIALAKVEIKSELEKVHRYSAVLAWKWAAIAISQMLFAMALVFFISDVTSLPLWAAFAIVSALCCALAFGLSRLNRLQVPFQSEISLGNNLKESIQCLTKRKC